ncbi:hypothetical protein ACFPRL_08175 [Pseudoclavibacter helvolus]
MQRRFRFRPPQRQHTRRLRRRGQCRRAPSRRRLPRPEPRP